MHGDDREVRNLGEEEVIRLERFVRQHIAGDVQDLKGRQVVDHVWKKVKILNLLVKKKFWRLYVNLALSTYINVFVRKFTSNSKTSTSTGIIILKLNIILKYC